jgi:aminoglycoside phosphotransferase family enzyme/predicted kinase
LVKVMISQDQSEVVAFLGAPHAHGGAAVERIDTHASIVFVAGDRALKLKRAVRYDYLDFSTLARRRAMCEAEIRINRQMAPELYRGVVAVTRQGDGALALDGDGTPVEWLVDMVRFDQEGLFDRLAARGALGLDLMPGLAEAIVRFHAQAARRADHGGAVGMAWVIEGNAAGFVEHGSDVLDAGACAALTRSALTAVDRHWPLLDARRDGGSVRQVHGDLHLRNIVLVDARPTLFDAIEFNDELACTDVLYDLAFLLMDLWRRRLPRHANAVWNGYLARTAELDGLPLLPLFLSCRAAVRAKTSVTAARLQEDPTRRRELEDAARDYLQMADLLLQPPAPCVVAIGGFSGSGKSTLARALAPTLGAVPGAVVVRSDEIRKQLCGVGPLARLGPEGYTPDVTRRVYGTIADRIRSVVDGSHAAIADAVCARLPDRTAIARIAEAAHVPFVGLWLDAPEAVLLARAGRRAGDASDADAAVIARQIRDGSGGVSWTTIDASGSPESVLAAAARAVDAHLGRTLTSSGSRLESPLEA